MNNMEVLIHNNAAIPVDYKKLFAASSKARSFQNTPIIINDMYDHRIFSTFMNIVCSNQFELDYSMPYQMTCLINEWNCPFVFQQIEQYILNSEDYNLGLAFLAYAPSYYLKIYQKIKSDPKHFASTYSMIYQLPTSILGSLFFNDENQQTMPPLSNAEAKVRFSQIPKRRPKKENTVVNKPNPEIIQLKQEIDSLSQTKSELQNKITSLTDKINSKENQKIEIKENTKKKLEEIETLLNSLGEKLPDLNSLEEKAYNLEKEKKELLERQTKLNSILSGLC